MKERGVLLAVSSLPSPWGVGDFGAAAYDWIDLLAENGVDLWQILPLNPVGYGNSPYQPYSSFALDEIYLSPEPFVAAGLLPKLPEPFLADAARVDYPRVRAYKEQWLRQAWRAFRPDASFEAFAREKQALQYAVFRAMKRAYQGACWTKWPAPHRDWPLRGVPAPEVAYEEVSYQLFLQFFAMRQWQDVRDHARARGVKILGDLPFYVGLDSSDVWAARENFLLDPNGDPKFVAGVPPDYFSPTGQRWGNPIYDWEALERGGFSFWISRFAFCASLYDVVRIDHFRAFDTYWKIPASCPTAVEGEWVEAPGARLLQTVQSELPQLRLVAEDLGGLRPEVGELRDRFRLQGMKVLQFSLDFSGRYARDTQAALEWTVAYTGTHDNATLREWVEGLSPAQRRKLRRWLKKQGLSQGGTVERLVEYTLASPAQTAVVPAADLLGLPASARMNTPGTVGSPNWEYRARSFAGLPAALRRFFGARA